MTATPRFAAATQLFAAVGHPVRLQALEVLEHAGAARSPKQIADVVERPLGVVSYHVRILAEDGLIRQTRTRPVRGAVEHFYVLTNRGRDALALMPAATPGAS